MTTTFSYGVYGIELHSEIRLNLPEAASHQGAGKLELRCASADTFSTAIAGSELVPCTDWYQYTQLADGTCYVRWQGVGEFLVSPNGARILCRQFPGAHPESFQVYLLSQALGFALVKAGFEPLHGTTVAHESDAIAFLGDCGFGKSTLAASLIAAGFRLLTDDLLLLRPAAGGLDACPGPPRIKLFPEVTEHFFGNPAAARPMNHLAKKQIIPLASPQTCSCPVPLRAMYVLEPPGKASDANGIRISSISGRDAFMALVENTFVTRIDDSARLHRQFLNAARIVQTVPVRKLSYPRSLACLREVREAILSDTCDFGCRLV